tara:strand:- start:440 stop:688 length:249 start_codon:yes stop_codon:yes gene_type:complete
MKITKRQLRRIIKEEKAKIIKEQDMNPSQLATMIEEAILENVYDIVADHDLSDGMQVPPDIGQAIAQGLRNAADSFLQEQGL